MGALREDRDAGEGEEDIAEAKGLRLVEGEGGREAEVLLWVEPVFCRSFSFLISSATAA